MIGFPRRPEKDQEAPLGSSHGANPDLGIPDPVAGLSTLLVWLCQAAMVISMEIGNWEKMWM